MYSVLGAESCSGETQQQRQQPIKTPHQKTSHPPSVNLLYPVVNKEVEQQFWGGGVTF
jgi:hypothetical protein